MTFDCHLLTDLGLISHVKRIQSGTSNSLAQHYTLNIIFQAADGSCLQECATSFSAYLMRHFGMLTHHQTTCSDTERAC